MTRYEKPKLVDLSAMEWEAGAGQQSCTVGSADTTGCGEQNPSYVCGDTATAGCTDTRASGCSGTD